MRNFSSYGPVDKDLHYYAPRKKLTDCASMHLTGTTPGKGGHYITVWAPRQTGKTWVMEQVLSDLRNEPSFDAVKIDLEHLKMEKNVNEVLTSVAEELADELDKPDIRADSLKTFQRMFTNNVLDKPLILILDEFDALNEDAVSAIVSVFRNIYIHRQRDPRPILKKKYVLHGVALIGVRSVLGVENVKGSPFNVQRSLKIPNLTFEEVDGMFRQYEKESGQKVEHEVINHLFYETQGQPGLTCWFGELLTETFNRNLSQPISMKHFKIVSAAAIKALPNNNILNIISKADKEPAKSLVLKLFRTGLKSEFSYDDKQLNYLYLNGVIEPETVNETEYYVRFTSPFVQKRLFNYFAREIFGEMGNTHEPFEDLRDTFTEKAVNIKNLMRRFQTYLKKNRDWLLKDAPRRKDMRIFEAVYHFNLYRYLCDFLGSKKARVYPEFPTGNGKVDIIIEYADRMYAIEIKSYTDEIGYCEALEQAAGYGAQLGLEEIALVFFVEYVNDANREKYEKDYTDEKTGVSVRPIFVETGN